MKEGEGVVQGEKERVKGYVPGNHGTWKSMAVKAQGRSIRRGILTRYCRE